MYDLFFVSAGQTHVKKDNNVINKKNMYLNYGLLSLATIAKQRGYHPVQIHGRFFEPQLIVEQCIELGLSHSTDPIFISIPSFYAIEWVKIFTHLIKNTYRLPNKIIVGGRWVIDNRADLLQAQLPNVDLVWAGLGEEFIAQVLPVRKIIVQEPIDLDYSIVYERALYQPSIEISRGCGMGCHFCQEKDAPLQALKNANVLLNEVKHTLLNDNLNKMTPYLEASMFVPNKSWAQDFIDKQQEQGFSFSWRSESRVDTLKPSLMPLLAKAGMEIIDLGLESASHAQIKRMGKSVYPERYLERASDLLFSAKENNIKVKVNLLLYAGEKKSTIDETYKWLDQHKDTIHGVSIGPVIAFGWDQNKKGFVENLMAAGAKISNTDSFMGITQFHLSETISRKDSLKIAKELSREFMTEKSYFDLKSYSYYPRDYTFTDFQKDVRNTSGEFSFRLSNE